MACTSNVRRSHGSCEWRYHRIPPFGPCSSLLVSKTGIDPPFCGGSDVAVGHTLERCSYGLSVRARGHLYEKVRSASAEKRSKACRVSLLWRSCYHSNTARFLAVLNSPASYGTLERIECGAFPPGHAPLPALVGHRQRVGTTHIVICISTGHAPISSSHSHPLTMVVVLTLGNIMLDHPSPRHLRHQGLNTIRYA